MTETPELIAAEIRSWVKLDQNESPDKRWPRREVWNWLLEVAERLEAGREGS